MFVCHVNQLTSKNMLFTHTLPPLFRGELYTPSFSTLSFTSFLFPLPHSTPPGKTREGKDFPLYQEGIKGCVPLKKLCFYLPV